jgi:hypothetical protein
MNPISAILPVLLAVMGQASLIAATIESDEVLLTSHQGQGTRIASVTLVNDWDELFTITEVNTGCCTRYDLTTTTLMPQDKTELFLILDVGLDATDEVKKIVVVGKGSTGRTQRIPFMLKHTITPVLTLSRKGLHWAKGGTAEPLEVTMSIAPRQALKIRSIQVAANSNLSVTSTIADSGLSATATVTLLDPTKPTTEFLSVATDSLNPRLAVFPILCTNEMPDPGKPVR